MTAAAPGLGRIARAQAASERASTAAVRSGWSVTLPVAALVAGVAWSATGAAAALPIAGVGALAAVGAVSDVRTGRIPNRLTLGALAILAGSLVIVAVIDDRSLGSLSADLAAGLVLSGAPAMFLVWLVTPGAVGGGDWKLLGVLGMAVGFVAPLGAAVILTAASVVGLTVAAFSRRRHIILGPPLALGYAAAVAAVVIAPDLFGNWYR